MTHQNHQTNGASLEDCHTNFFALTELYGIKWRKLVWGETSGGGDGEEGAAPLADPVISSYARCLAGDILCVWRRVPTQPPPSVDIYEMRASARPPPLSLRAAKELWIFWYGEEPDLNGLVAPELISSQGEQGSWESGLSYECRSLLFKALHNLIERCLLSRDFVRLGKWFVQPYDGDEEDVGKSPWHLSFSFAFFLHGESTVCASVDVRQHPPVRTLTAKRLQRLHAAERQPDAKVILAPFGLEGTLTGREWTDSDPATARLFDAWRQHYPLEQGCGAVEVWCGGARMRYPLPYVLVTEMEAPPVPAPAHAPSHSHALAPHTLAALATPAPHQTAELCYGDAASDKNDDFVDPTRKTPCTCAKWRRRRLRPPPFHRRTRPHHPPAHRPKAQAHAQSVTGGVVGGCSPGSGSCGGGSPGAGGSAPPSAGPPPNSPHHQHHAHAQHHHGANNNHQSANVVPTTLHTPAPTPDPHAPPTPAPPSLPPPKAYNQGDSPPSGGGANALCASDGGDQPLIELGRPPTLPSAERRLDPLEDEHSLHMLYDYSTVYAWLEHPVKRFKTDEVCFREELALGSNEGDLYAGHEHTSMPATPHYERRDYKQERHDHDDTKEYKNLFTSDGLCPTFKDLEQIFDNSDDAASGDETVRLLQVSTPPDSNKSLEERGCAGRMVRAEELSKMFPTPPSMEAHAQPSPGGFTLPDDATPHQRHSNHHTAAGSPSPDTTIEDWSFVFKPPTVWKYVGSSKYAPLATLPSHLLPPVVLPPNAVYRPRRRRDDTDTSSTSHNNNGDTDDTCRTGVKRSASPASDCRENRSRRSCEVGTGTGTGPPSRGDTHPHSNDPGSVGRHNIRSPSTGREPRGAGGGAGAPADPLLLNVLLGDTVLNVFRDHNFDSCTLCVCNVSPQVVVGNIRGADASTYLCGWGGGEGADSPLPEEDACRCTCGFSAIINRRLAYKAGLFLEDEIEITGLSEEPSRHKSGGGVRGLGEVAGVVVAQCAALSGGRASALARAAAAAARSAASDDHRLNLLEYTDGNTAATRALRAATGSPSALCGASGTASAVHRWPFISARAPRSSRDVVRLMRRLRPLLQDAIQKRCCGARMWDGVTGPLTWRQFHRLAGRGNEDLCEPQPVPPLLVGHDRDWISLSPYALRHWERLSLEPYSYSRDVAYVVLAADGDVLTEPLRTFFRELSTAYESCRLGKHQPINRVARDGIIRTSPADRDANCEEWTGTLPPGRLGEYIRAYAETLRTNLVPQLASLTIDRSLIEEERSTFNERPAPSPMRPPSTPDHPGTPTGHSDHEGDGSANNSGCGTSSSSGLGSGAMGSWEEEEGGPPALVVYVVEPPAAQAHRSHALHALLRLAARTYHHLHHHNPLIKIISLESVCASWGMGGGCGGAEEAASGWCGEGSEARALAFSVFSGARRLLQHHANGKSLTGFGTAADANLFLQSKDEKNRAPYKLFSPPWVLAAPRTRPDSESWAQAGVGVGSGAGGEGAVLFLAYCLSHDQRWLLAAATDARGEMLDTAAINIHVPHRSRRRGGGPARRHGLTKLMDFALGLMSQTAQPWRLVVGRVGRIGHGELKGWNWLLSRKHLERASATLRQVCGSCAASGPSGTPGVLSACLVSTEPAAALRLMADRFTPDERFSQASIHSHLHTPRDVTATHILVFPTSATTQSNQTPFEPSMANGEDDIFLSVDMGEEEMGEENITDLLVGDMFNIWPTSSPRRHDDDPASPQAQHQHNAAYHHQEEQGGEQAGVGLVLQQPLALGYLVSTAPLEAMPAWWWAQCAHLRGLCPAFLKSALHLHTASAPDEDAFSHAAATQPPSAHHRHHHHHQHPLDSQITTDVLRYVLEGYNALSWLTLDGNTHDRLSCLPLHVQVLMQLYHTAAALG